MKQQKKKVFVYFEISKEFIFRDFMRYKYGKTKYPELQTCVMPNGLSYVCKEKIPIITYVPNDDCESTFIHPSTISIPHNVCQQGMLTLEQTYWNSLHVSNVYLLLLPGNYLL